MSNFSLTAADAGAASQIRKDCEAHFDQDPVFLHARATLDTAVAKAPDTTYDEVPSIVQRNRAAFAELKASLATIRSNSANNSTNFFSDSIPTTRGESTIRALVAVDCVNEDIPVPNPPTSITANIRPHNPESFKLVRKTFLQGTESTFPNPNKIRNSFKVVIKLADGAKRSSVDQVLGVARQMIPSGGSEKWKFNLRISDDGAYLIVTAGAQEGVEDPLEGAVKVLNRSRGAADASKRGRAVAATDIFRLGTVRLDIPHDLGEFLTAKQDASWITLLEGVRIAAEIVTRDSSAEFLKDDIVGPLLRGKGIGLHAVKTALATIGAMECVKENSVKVKLAPAELLFALGVQENASPMRLHFASQIAHESDYDVKYADGSESRSKVSEFFASTATEEQVASFLAAKLKLGATSTRLFQFVKYNIGSAFAASQGRLEPIVNMFLPMKDLIEEVSSVSLLTPTGVVDLDIKGINSKLWRWMPATAQEALDAAKPIGLAFCRDLDALDAPAFDPAQATAERFLGRNPDMFSGVFAKLVKEVAATCFKDVNYTAVTGNVLPVIERSVPKTCTMSAPYMRSSAWDLPLPSDLTCFESAIQHGRKIYAASRIAAHVGTGRISTAFSEMPDFEFQQAKIDDPTLFASPEDEARLRAMFRQFHQSGTGYLNRSEAMSVFEHFYPDESAESHRRRLHHADTNKDGKLSFVEFVKIAKVANQ